MIVNRKNETEGPATLSLYFRKPDAAASEEGQPEIARTQNPSSSQGASRAPEPAADEDVVRLDVKNKHQTDILALLMAETRATPVEPDEAARAEMASLEAMATLAAKGRAGSLAALAARREAESQLERARKSAAIE